MTAPDRLYSTKEVAKKYGLTRQWITELCERGVIPAQKIGGVYLIAESDLVKVEKRNRLRGRSAAERKEGK